MKRFTFLLVGFICLIACNSSQTKTNTPLYLDDSQDMEVRVEDALSRMTLEEKIAIIHAQSKFSSPGVPRLGIPENWMSDGPHGIRNEVIWDEWAGAKWTNDSCTAFPALTCLAATWNREMAQNYGHAIGEEARYRNKNVLLGPGVNICRTPLNGRSFEYFGEDPYLSSELSVAYIQNVQKNGVAACVKHFALNNQEYDRHHVDVDLSERALYEIYLPAFKASVQEGEAWAIMGSYNKFRGEHCCHNDLLLNKILKEDWAFDGVVVSDWGGVIDTKQAIENGLDMEFGTWTDGLTAGKSNAYDAYCLADAYLNKIKAGEYGEEELNEKVRRVLRLSMRTTMDKNRPYGSFATEAHAMVGRKVAQEGIVLLKNEGNLPIDIAKGKKVLVVGENATKSLVIGGGSSGLKAKYEVSPLQGIMNRVGEDGEVNYAQGYRSKSQGKDIKIDYEGMRSEAVAQAKESDVVIFVGGLNKNKGQDSESNDRLSYGLPYMQDELIEALVDANPNTVVVILSGNAVAMPWADKANSIVEGWYCGTEAGNALASVLFGDVNPSGKLPVTFYESLEQCGSHSFDEKSYPGLDQKEYYEEDILVGYRWIDAKNLKPLFPFGHGLSYTKFEYSNPKISSERMKKDGEILVSVDVTNTGKMQGAEVVQMYISDKESSVMRPVKELKGFDKVYLEPGETKTVSFVCNEEMLKFYDENKATWVSEKGEFNILIGASSADIKHKLKFTL